MKKILSTIFAATLFITSIQGVSASEDHNKNGEPTQTIAGNNESDGLSAKQEEALKTYTELFVDSGMYQDFEISDKGEMISNKSFAQLQSEYNLTDEEINFIENIVTVNNQSALAPSEIPAAPNPRLRMSIKNFRVYLTYGETKSYLGSAVIAGPIAVIGALATIGSVVGGPIGTVVCSLAGVYGANYIVEVTKSAINKRKGIWLGWGGIGIN